MDTTSQIGQWGEDQAARFLARKGYRVVGTRVRLDRRDEIDLVVRDGKMLVFVEVKTRRSVQFGRPASAVTRSKRTVLSRAAVRYMKRLRKPPEYFRFDVVEVIGQPDDSAKAPEILHIENAFTLDSRFVWP